ncbi:MAG TPA: hypothetical protein VN767_28355 [Streptosporangiaceae bacterium]|nr:hypothetical protein [Streptosporangiaceae bacterium]
MDDAVIGLVRDIIAKYGIDVSANARRLENFLADLSKKHRLENAALVAAVKEGIPTELRAAGRQAVPGIAGDRFVQLLREHQGLDADVARWAVRAWARALDVTGLRFRTSGPARLGARAGWPGEPDDSAAQVARLAGKASAIAQAIGEPRSKALALASLATVVGYRDRDEATGLLKSAESLAGSIPSWHDRTLTLHAIAITIAGTEPDRAEALARSIGHDLLTDSVLSHLVEGLRSTDPDRALRLARSIRQPALQACELIAVAAALAQADLDRAERLAGSLAGDYWRAEALSAVASEAAVTGAPATETGRAGRLADAAERLARGVPGGPAKIAALASAARARHLLDADRAAGLFAEAERLAREIKAEPDRSRALGSLAIALMVSDPRRGAALGSLGKGCYVTGELAKMLVATDPVQAVRLAEPFANPRAPIGESAFLVDVAQTVAESDPDEALRLAWSVASEQRRAQALVAIARTLMRTDRDRAAKLLADIERSADHMNVDEHVDLCKVQVLADVADAWAGEL